LASPHDSGDSTSESVEHRRSNIVTKAGKKTGVNTKSIDATKIDAPGAKSLKSSRYNITPLKKGSVDSDRKAQKIQKAQKISSRRFQHHQLQAETHGCEDRQTDHHVLLHQGHRLPHQIQPW
jgi:hypothetical protein